MFLRGIEMFIAEDSFCVEQDMSSRLEQSASNELHALAYVPAEYKERLPLSAIARRARSLMTPIDFACYP